MPQKGEDILYELTISLEEAAFGGEKRISYRKDGKIEEVTIHKQSTRGKVVKSLRARIR
jgi:DnaJ-class molecular chaperone